MEMRAKHIMREGVYTGPDTSVKDVAHKIISTGLPGLPVVNSRMEVMGIVTEFNVLGAMREGFDLETITATRIMNMEPITADITTSANDLIQMMLLNNFTLIPIVSNNRYAGVVSRHIIMDAMLSPFYANFTARERKGPFVCK